MKIQWIFKQKGVTLIELLVALVICAVVIGSIYRLFIVQTRAYTVQDQVVEVQQSVRGAMEILLRDLRMTGYDDDNAASTVTVPTPPIVMGAAGNSIAVSYEYFNTTTAQYELHTVSYSDDATMRLMRQLTVTPGGGGSNSTTESILENVDDLTFTYGIDTDENGSVDSWVAAAGVGTSKVIAVRASLTARPPSLNPDVQARVIPRTLNSAVSFRNLIMK
jgi:type IV pilus assembly protein PilW